MPTKSALLVLATIALIGCSASPGAASPSVASTPDASSPPAAPSVAPSAPASAAPSVAPSPSTAAELDLATVLPKTAGGHALDTMIISPAALATTHSLAGVKAILGQMKVDPASARVAIGWGGASAGEQIVTAIQVPGASSTAMKAFEHGIDPIAITMGLAGTAATVGGKSVLTFSGKPPTYVYIVGDTAFVITADSTTAEEVLSALP